MNTHNPKRLDSDKLRASPWQVNRGEVNEEENGSRSCARRLFVKKTEPAKAVKEIERVMM